MTEAEIAKLLRFVHALCPAQKFDEYSPDAWELVLGDVPFDDARDALKKLGQQLRFIAPSDIAQEVRRVRNARAAQYTDYADTLPDADPDRPLDYIRALREHNFRAASQLPARPVRQAIESEFVYIRSKWSREPAPLKAIEAAPNPEFDAARAVLGELPPERAQDFLTEAREQLEAEGVPLEHRGVAVRAARLAGLGGEAA
ncbi:MAG: hypothetical protein ACJ786_21800 [Catenulispora sp.]|jgi:hypothetical protein